MRLLRLRLLLSALTAAILICWASAWANEASRSIFLSKDIVTRTTQNPRWMLIPYTAETLGFWTMDLSATYLATHSHWALLGTLGFDVVSTSLQASLGSSQLLGVYDRYNNYAKLQELARGTGADKIYSVSSAQRDYIGPWADAVKTRSLYLVEASGQAAETLRNNPEEWTEVDTHQARIRLSLKMAGYEGFVPDAELSLADFLEKRPIPEKIAKIWRKGADLWAKNLPVWNRRLWLNKWDDVRVSGSFVPEKGAAPIPIGDLYQGRLVNLFLKRDIPDIAKNWAFTQWSKLRGQSPPPLTQKVGGRSSDIVRSERCKKGIVAALKKLSSKTIEVEKTQESR